MSEHESDDQSLCPEETLSQAAALARHLQSSGVEFLPTADEQSVQQWASQFRTPDAPQAQLEPQSQAATTQTRSIAEGTATAPTAAPARTPAPARDKPKIVADIVKESYAGDPLDQSTRASQLQTLQATVAACTLCEKLASCRKNTVFGEGHPMPRVAFFGEGPGADEDRTGRPFVGKAGQLLTKMIEACSFKREDVYILNTVKCRPPGNRNPEPSEIENCRAYFEQQLQILRPEYIVCLGAVSSQTLLKSKLSVGRLRGKFHRYYDSKVLVTYHPAYLLRTPAAKKAAWEDLQLMLRDAGIRP